MLDFGPTFIWTAVNLLVLFFVLRAILFKRITVFMGKRADSIRNAIEAAEIDRQAAHELKDRYEAFLKETGKEAGRITDEARQQSDAKHRVIVDTAKAEAQAILQHAREEIEQERRQMIKAVRNQVVELVLLASSKVVEANLDNAGNRVLVERFIDEAEKEGG